MAKIEGDQSIPSELADIYDGTLTLKTPTDIVRSRYPWRLPKYPDAYFSGTPLQNAIRLAFRRCVDCYNAAPFSGGATPPASGPRSREWWYNAAGGSGLWYYDYFIQQTIPDFINEVTPVWCRTNLTADANVQSANPNTNYGGASGNVPAYAPAGVSYAYIKNPYPPLSTWHAYVYLTSPFGPEDYLWKIGVYAVASNWAEYSITWNNRPPLGALIKVETVTTQTGWISVSLGAQLQSFALVWLSGSIGPDGISSVAFASRTYIYSQFRPFFSA